MISFRFHLVSLIAVFLAVGIGIAVGATVVNEATVELLRAQLQRVDARATSTNAENDRLRKELRDWSAFSEQLGDELLRGRLSGAEVLLLGVHGTNREPLERLRQALATSGARVPATLWLTGKMRLEDPRSLATLADLLGLSSSNPDTVRRALVTRLAELLAGGGAAPLLQQLRENAYVEVEPGQGDGAVPMPLGGTATRFLLASDPNADVPNADLAVPFATQLARHAPARVLAAEAIPAAEDVDARQRFVTALRESGAVSGVLSTVDNISDPRGRVAVVLALDALGPNGTVGHYGAGPRATRLVPEPVAS